MVSRKEVRAISAFSAPPGRRSMEMRLAARYQPLDQLLADQDSAVDQERAGGRGKPGRQQVLSMPYEQEEKGWPRPQGEAIGESLARSAHEPSLRRRQKTQAANGGRKCGLFGITHTWPRSVRPSRLRDRERPDAPWRQLPASTYAAEFLCTRTATALERGWLWGFPQKSYVAVGGESQTLAHQPMHKAVVSAGAGYKHHSDEPQNDNE